MTTSGLAARNPAEGLIARLRNAKKNENRLMLFNLGYSAPPEYLGRKLWVRSESRLVRVFNCRMEQIAVHVKREAGRFSTQSRHIAPQKRSRIEKGAAHLLNQAGLIGVHTGQWAEQMVHQRGIEGVRVLMGLLNLAQRHECEAIEQACAIASTHGAYRLRI